ncbi:MAG: ThiF family adenylyltransferase [Pirellula sp.]|jgi:molybdopterin/thiamine biosynthesis adenylyltransferase
MVASLDRFKRQVAYAPVGVDGQRRLAEARVAVCGMGALGSTIAERLVRCGVGTVHLIDRDWVELDNLPRQALYTMHDAEYHVPKSIAAANRLVEIDPSVQLHPHVCDLTYRNIQSLLSGMDLVLDGTDNFEVRYLINDACVAMGIPWVHGGIVGASGQAMLIEPGRTACFRCLLPDPPPVEGMQTCDSAGVLGPAVGVVACWQALLGLKWLVSNTSAQRQPIEKDSQLAAATLTVFDLWAGETRNIHVVPDPQCVCCKRREFPFLSGLHCSDAKVLCGKNAVQITVPSDRTLDLGSLANRLRSEGAVIETPFLLRFTFEKFTISVFSDGRGIVSGTENPDEARKIYQRWIGG